MTDDRRTCEEMQALVNAEIDKAMSDDFFEALRQMIFSQHPKFSQASKRT